MVGVIGWLEGDGCVMVTSARIGWESLDVANMSILPSPFGLRFLRGPIFIRGTSCCNTYLVDLNMSAKRCTRLECLWYHSLPMLHLNKWSPYSSKGWLQMQLLGLCIRKGALIRNLTAIWNSWFENGTLKVLEGDLRNAP